MMKFSMRREVEKAFISPQAPNAKKLKTDAKNCHYAMNAAVVGKEYLKVLLGKSKWSFYLKPN